jgi:hypothetical protein
MVKIIFALLLSLPVLAQGSSGGYEKYGSLSVTGEQFLYFERLYDVNAPNAFSLGFAGISKEDFKAGTKELDKLLGKGNQVVILSRKETAISVVLGKYESGQILKFISQAFHRTLVRMTGEFEGTFYSGPWTIYPPPQSIANVGYLALTRLEGFSVSVKEVLGDKPYVCITVIRLVDRLQQVVSVKPGGVSSEWFILDKGNKLPSMTHDDMWKSIFSKYEGDLPTELKKYFPKRK